MDTQRETVTVPGVPTAPRGEHSMDPNELDRPRWMSNAQFEILRFLFETRYRGDRIMVTPKVIGLNSGVSHGAAMNQLAELVEHGLVEKVDRGRGIYRITGAGESYMQGLVSAAQLE